MKKYKKTLFPSFSKNMKNILFIVLLKNLILIFFQSSNHRKSNKNKAN